MESRGILLLKMTAPTCRYASRLAGKMPVVLLTNDADNRRKAVADGLDARGVYQYAKELKVWAGEREGRQPRSVGLEAGRVWNPTVSHTEGAHSLSQKKSVAFN